MSSQTVPGAGVTISTYLRPAEAAILRDRAAAADRSVAAEIRRALREYLEDDKRRASNPAPSENRPGGGRHDTG